MADGREAASFLLADVVSLLDRLSTAQHRLARNHRILTRAATLLRLGKSAETVLADIGGQSPELLRDYGDLQPRLTPSVPDRLVEAARTNIRFWRIPSVGEGHP